MKPHRDRDVQRDLRDALSKMPDDVAKIVREACQKRGLLPGGGQDKPDKPKDKTP